MSLPSEIKFSCGESFVVFMMDSKESISVIALDNDGHAGSDLSRDQVKSLRDQLTAWLGDEKKEVVLTDVEIFEAMHSPLYDADGGYLVDTAPKAVMEAGRRLLARHAARNKP